MALVTWITPNSKSIASISSGTHFCDESYFGNTYPCIHQLQERKLHSYSWLRPHPLR